MIKTSQVTLSDTNSFLLLCGIVLLAPLLPWPIIAFHSRGLARLLGNTVFLSPKLCKDASFIVPLLLLWVTLQARWNAKLQTTALTPVPFY